MNVYDIHYFIVGIIVSINVILVIVGSICVIYSPKILRDIVKKIHDCLGSLQSKSNENERDMDDIITENQYYDIKDIISRTKIKIEEEYFTEERYYSKISILACILVLSR